MLYDDSLIESYKPLFILFNVAQLGRSKATSYQRQLLSRPSVLRKRQRARCFMQKAREVLQFIRI